MMASSCTFSSHFSRKPKARPRSWFPNLSSWFPNFSLAGRSRFETDMDKTLKQASPCFKEEAFASIANGYRIAAVPHAVKSLQLNRNNENPWALFANPSSVNDFISQTDHIFAPEFARHIQEKCAIFDRLCGAPISDAIFSELSLQERALEIVNNTLKFYDKPRPPFPGDRGRSRDGTSDSPPEARPIPITQMKLKGPTIKEAWRTNAAAQAINPLERVSLGQWNPSISTPSSLPVFHGTDAHLHENTAPILKQALEANPTMMRRAYGQTQLFPAGQYCGIYTSFSAMRAFLWSCFKAEVIMDPPGPTTFSRLQQPFQLNGQNLRGTLLLEFDINQPAPAGLSWYMVPVGKESDWFSRVRHSPSILTSTTAWGDSLKAIHGQDSLDYPDVTHGRDLPEIRNALADFPCNKTLLWQTAWMSEHAENILNERVTNIYAISFELEDPLSPSKPKKRRIFTRTNKRFAKG